MRCRLAVTILVVAALFIPAAYAAGGSAEAGRTMLVDVPGDDLAGLAGTVQHSVTWLDGATTLYERAARAEDGFVIVGVADGAPVPRLSHMVPNGEVYDLDDPNQRGLEWRTIGYRYPGGHAYGVAVGDVIRDAHTGRDYNFLLLVNTASNRLGTVEVDLHVLTGTLPEPAPAAHAYRDNDCDGAFTNVDVAIANETMADGKYDAGDACLVLPAASPAISAKTIDLKGAGLSVSVPLRADEKLSLFGGAHGIDVAGSSLAAGKQIKIESDGPIEAGNAAISSANEDVTLSGGAVAAHGTITAAKKVTIQGTDGDLERLQVQAANEGIRLRFSGEVSAVDALFEADKTIDIEARVVFLPGADLDAGDKIQLDGANGIDLDAARLVAGDRITADLQSGADIRVQGAAWYDDDDHLQQTGGTVVGTPSHGTI